MVWVVVLLLEGAVAGFLTLAFTLSSLRRDEGGGARQMLYGSISAGAAAATWTVIVASPDFQPPSLLPAACPIVVVAVIGNRRNVSTALLAAAAWLLPAGLEAQLLGTLGDQIGPQFQWLALASISGYLALAGFIARWIPWRHLGGKASAEPDESPQSGRRPFMLSEAIRHQLQLGPHGRNSTVLSVVLAVSAGSVAFLGVLLTWAPVATTASGTVVCALAAIATTRAIIPAPVRRAIELFAWLAKREVGRLPRAALPLPKTKAAAARWLATHAREPVTDHLRIELLCWLDESSSARILAEALPAGSTLERFEQTAQLSYIDWVEGLPVDLQRLRAAVDGIDDPQRRLEAEALVALQEGRVRLTEGEDWLEPLNLAWERLERAGRTSFVVLVGPRLLAQGALVGAFVTGVFSGALIDALTGTLKLVGAG